MEVRGEEDRFDRFDGYLCGGIRAGVAGAGCDVDLTIIPRIHVTQTEVLLVRIG